MNQFIEKTSKDYSVPYSEVQRIYNQWEAKGLFYEKLEEYIKDRKNSDETDFTIEDVVQKILKEVESLLMCGRLITVTNYIYLMEGGCTDMKNFETIIGLINSCVDTNKEKFPYLEIELYKVMKEKYEHFF